MTEGAPTQQQSRKRPIYKRWWFWVLAGLVVVIAAAAAGGGGSSTSADTPAPAQSPAGEGSTTVVYSLESDAPQVSASYLTVDGGSVGQEQANGVTPPWSTTVQVEDSFLGGSYTLTGQMMPGDPGGPQGSAITCRIEVGGEIVAEQTSTGQFAVVTCNAT